MTVSTTTSRAELNGNTTVGPFNCGFRILADSDLDVYVGEAIKTINTHYTIANAGTTTNATVTFTSGNEPANGTKNVVLVRNVPNTQLSNYQNNSSLDAETLETSLDRATMQVQQLATLDTRIIKFADTVVDLDSDQTEISASKTDRASKYVSFDGNGDIVVSSSTEEIIVTSSNVKGNIIRYDDDTARYINSDILAVDDVKLYFGTGKDVSIEYDENNNNTLSIDGDTLLEDDKKLYFGSGKDCYIEYDEDGLDTMVLGLPAGGGQILDDKPLYFGTAKDVLVEWDDGGDDTLLFKSLTGTALSIGLYSDAGENDVDKWKLSVADGGDMTFQNKISGSFQTFLTLRPHGTLASSDIIVAGNLTVSGTTYTVDAENLLIEDPLIYLAKANTSSDNLDIGLYGVYDVGGTDKFSGLFRDRSDSGKWKLFKDLSGESTLLNGTATEVNTGGTGYAVATLVANLEGNVTGNADTVTTNANLTGDVTSSGNATSIASDVIVNADIKSDAAIAMSKTALVAGTGITLSTNTLNVDAAQTQITSLGTLTGLTLSGASQFNNTVTVGVDDTGHDVKFFGATTGKYMLWDESADFLNIVGKDDNSRVINVQDGTNSLFHVATHEVVVNDDSRDTDFRVESDGNTHALFMQGSSGNVGIGDSDPSEAKLSIVSTANTVSGLRAYSDQGNSQDAPLVNFIADNTGFDQTALTIDYDGTSNAMIINHNGSGSSALQINNAGNSRAAKFYSNVGNSASSPLVEIKADHPDFPQPALKVIQDGAGNGILIDQNGDNIGLEIDQDGANIGLYIHQNTTNLALKVYQAAHGHGAQIIQKGNGNALHLDQDGNASALYINNSATGRGIESDTNATTWAAEFRNNNTGGLGIKIKAGNSSSESAFLVEDQSAQTSFKIDGAGQIYTPRMAGATGHYNVEYVSGGKLVQDSSTRRLKTNERELEVDTSDIYKMDVKSFNWDTDDITYSDMGLIAEDVQGINEFFVVMDHWKDETELSPTAVRNKRIMWAMLVEMQKLNDKVTALENA